jgi:hypothetical protein
MAFGTETERGVLEVTFAAGFHRVDRRERSTVYATALTCSPQRFEK